MKFFLNIKVSFPSLAPVSSTFPFSRLDNLTLGPEDGMAGLFQLPSLTCRLVCEARTKQGRRVVEKPKSRSCLAWNSPALSLISCAHKGSSVYWKSEEAQNLPSRLAFNYLALSLTLERPHISANFSWDKCVRILFRYYPDLRRCSERFLNICQKFPKIFRRFPKVAEDVQRLQGLGLATMHLDSK